MSKNFGNIADKQPFSEKISDLFFGHRSTQMSTDKIKLSSLTSLQVVKSPVKVSQN